jgi:hypothetical protein
MAEDLMPWEKALIFRCLLFLLTGKKPTKEMLTTLKQSAWVGSKH